MHGRRFTPSGPVGRLLRWATGPWSSANGLSWFRLILIIVVVQWGLLEFYMIPSSSMEPTLHGDPRFFSGDRVAVNKLAFGARLPFTRTRLAKWGEPKRWDVVVFDTVSSRSEQDVLIKRVVGLPGERVEIKLEGIFINGELVEPPEQLKDAVEYTLGKADTDRYVRILLLDFAVQGGLPPKLARMDDPRIKGLREDLKALQRKLRAVDVAALTGREKREYIRQMRRESVKVVQDWWTAKIAGWGRSRYGVIRKPEYTIVPPGHYFCLGDNGPESQDSRFFGWIPHENLVGRAFAVAYPPSRVRDLTGFSKTAPGLLALIGIPLAIVLWELLPGFVVFSWRVRGTIPALGLKTGDHVLVDRIALGPRIPFSSSRFLWGRDPKPGEIVCYSFTGGRKGATDIYFGEVRESSGHRYVVRGPDREGERWLDLGRDSIVGIARSVWWPAARRGKIRTAETGRR